MKTRHLRILFILGLGLILALLWLVKSSSTGRAAGPWYVAPDGNDDDNDCLSPGAACATINGAIAKASAGDTVYVATGTYTDTGDQVTLLDKDITLSGGWDASFTAQSGSSIIDSEGARRGITVNSEVIATVEGFTVQNGYSIHGGGGIYNEGTVTISNSNVSGNTTDNFGGGIRNWEGTVTLNNSAIRGNAAYEGGGIWNHGNLTLNNSTVNDNTGGGIYGGGTLTLTNSTVSSNTASNGGGIWSYGNLTLNNSTVSGNTATYVFADGGGILVSMGTTTLNNSTVSGNASAQDGGGIHHRDGTVILQNTIVAGNSAANPGNAGLYTPDCRGTIGSSGYNLIGNVADCTFASTDGDLTNIDPQLGSLEGSPCYHPLLPGSPAVDAGNPAGCADHLGHPLPTDQRGMPRIRQCDIGAYELVIFELNVTKQANSDTVQPGAQLTYTIRVTNTGDMDLNATITDTLPISVTLRETSGGTLISPGGTVILPNGRVAITWTAVITAPGGLWTGTIVVTVDEDQEGPLANLVEVTTEEGAMSKAIAIVNSNKIYLPLVMRNSP